MKYGIFFGNPGIRESSSNPRRMKAQGSKLHHKAKNFTYNSSKIMTRTQDFSFDMPSEGT